MKRRARGMTLIEVLVALLVATVGLVGALAMLGTLFTGSMFSRQSTEASVLLQSKMEELQMAVVTVGPSTPVDGLVAPSEACDAQGCPPQSAAAAPFTRSVTWGTTTDNLRRTVQVEVTWADSMNTTHRIVANSERVP